MRNLPAISVFLASPGDVFDWREKAEEVINKIGKLEKKYNLRVLRWEKDLTTTSGIPAQEHINDTLLTETDILVGIFWTKFGTKTIKADSGTLEEIEMHLSKGKPTIIYFIDKEIKPSLLDPDQFRKVKDFKERYGEANIYKSVKTLEDLEDSLRRDIPANVDKIIAMAPIEHRITDTVDVTNNEVSSGVWFENSITGYINEYLENRGFVNSRFNRDLIFTENCRLAN